MLEKRFIAIPPQLLTSNGGANGIITVTDTRLFKVKQEVVLTGISLPVLDTLEVKRINSQTQMVVGPRSANINTTSDLSAYTTAANSAIFANEQKRPSIPVEETTRAVYEEEPTSAIRSMLVDKNGNDYRTENPLPVRLSDGSINIGTVNAELEVQLSHKDNVPNSGDIADSVRIGNGTFEANVFNDGALSTRPDNKLIDLPHDTLQVISKTAAGDPTVIAVKVGGLSGTTVRTLTIAYDIQGNIQSVVKT